MNREEVPGWQIRIAILALLGLLISLLALAAIEIRKPDSQLEIRSLDAQVIEIPAPDWNTSLETSEETNPESAEPASPSANPSNP